MLGGRGKSASLQWRRAITFANNEGWHDDISDGPVTAEVTLDGRELRGRPRLGGGRAAQLRAAAEIGAHDVGSDARRGDQGRHAAEPGAAVLRPRHPAALRAAVAACNGSMPALPPVSAGRAPSDFATPGMARETCRRNSADTAELRHVIANQFRDFDRDSWSPVPWPWLYGDAMNIPPAETPRQNAALTDTQLALLQQWSAGDFDADYVPAPHAAERISRTCRSPSSGDMLDRASLEFCLADAFHPGCEMTWPMRTAGHLHGAVPHCAMPHPAGSSPNMGRSSAPISSPSARWPAAHGQLPGGITRWMAVPWQTDTASCRSGY